MVKKTDNKKEQVITVTTKPWYQSKTVWFNLVFVALGVVDWLLGSLGYQDFQPSEESTEFLTAVLILGNIFLRKLTTTKITVKGDDAGLH